MTRKLLPALTILAALVATLAYPPVGHSDPTSPPATTTTILFVRHAEKESGSDPDLTEAGHRRAHDLVATAGRAGVDTIYVTQFQRTRRTAEPLAEKLGLTPVIFKAEGSAEQHARDLVADIRNEHTGDTVVVVGHSNTVPLMLAALGVEPAPVIEHDAFDSLFIVNLEAGADVRFIEARYGD